MARGEWPRGPRLPPKLELNLPPDQHSIEDSTMAEKKKKAKKKTK